MAFTFVVETGAVVAGANSYLTVAEADDYFVVDPRFAATWAAYTTDIKQKRLVLAARFLDQRAEWYGQRASADQEMRWPRYGTKDSDGVCIPDDVIPEQLKQAVLEMTKYMTSKDPTTSQDIEFLKRATLDVLEVEFQDGSGQVSMPPLISDLLVGLGNFQIGGHRFAKIVKV